MKINLKYGYVVDVDNYNPYTLMREDVKDGKLVSKDRTYLYSLDKLMDALQYGKEYLHEYIEPLRELADYQDEVVELFSDNFTEVRVGQIYDKDLVELDLGGYVGVYTPNNRILSLDKKVFDGEGQPVYEIPKEGVDIEPKQVTRRLSYCKWVRDFVTEFVVANLVDKNVEVSVSLEQFIEKYKDELEVLRSGVTVERTVVKPEVEEDEEVED